LDAAYPNGPYTFTVTTARGELLTLPLNLPATPFPDPPHVNNGLATQTINAAQDFVLIWDALQPGLPTDWLQFEIEDPANSQVVFASPNADEEDRLDGTSTAMTIPAYTLLPGKQYLAVLDFSRITGTNTVSSPFSDGFSAFATVTGFQLTTISNLRKGAGKVKFSATKFTVNDNVGNATISLLRPGGNSLPTSVYYATSNATAHAGIDYTSATGTLVFSNGVTSQAFTIPIAPHSGSNGTKTVTLLLSPIVKGVPHRTKKATLFILGE
jgi:Calx-beta domain